MVGTRTEPEAACRLCRRPQQGGHYRHRSSDKRLLHFLQLYWPNCRLWRRERLMSFEALAQSAERLRAALHASTGRNLVAAVSLEAPGNDQDEAAFLRLIQW